VALQRNFVPLFGFFRVSVVMFRAIAPDVASVKGNKLFAGGAFDGSV
jgi:hypothetical protein